MVGGAPGFARVESPTRLCLDVPAGAPRPVRGGCVSMVFLLTGIGETLRLNGSVAEAAGTRLTLDVHESFVHCARCVLRSRLWHEPPTEPAPRRRYDDTTAPLRDDTTAPLRGGADGPLLERAAAEFLASSPFVLVSSWDGGGRGDTSPKGDLAGFVRVLDGHTLVPDRRGNRRADTLRKASVTRLAVKGLAASPGLARRAIDAGYRNELRDEGYEG